jgi:hypothetical protein
MPTSNSNPYKKIKHVVYFTTNSGFNCEHCDFSASFNENWFDKAINHYIEKHSYTLLHVGGEAGLDAIRVFFIGQNIKKVADSGLYRS